MLGHRTIDSSSSFVHHGTSLTFHLPAALGWVLLVPLKLGFAALAALDAQVSFLIAGWQRSVTPARGAVTGINLSVHPSWTSPNPPCCRDLVCNRRTFGRNLQLSSLSPGSIQVFPKETFPTLSLGAVSLNVSITYAEHSVFGGLRSPNPLPQ